MYMTFTEEDIKKAHKVLKNPTIDPEYADEINDYVNRIKSTLINGAGITKEFRSSCKESFDHFKTKEPHIMVCFIRELTAEKVMISYKIVPEFMEIVENYRTLVIKARAYK